MAEPNRGLGGGCTDSERGGHFRSHHSAFCSTRVERGREVDVFQEREFSDLHQACSTGRLRLPIGGHILHGIVNSRAIARCHGHHRNPADPLGLGTRRRICRLIDFGDSDPDVGTVRHGVSSCMRKNIGDRVRSGGKSLCRHDSGDGGSYQDCQQADYGKNYQQFDKRKPCASRRGRDGKAALP